MDTRSAHQIDLLSTIDVTDTCAAGQHRSSQTLAPGTRPPFPRTGSTIVPSSGQANLDANKKARRSGHGTGCTFHDRHSIRHPGSAPCDLPVCEGNGVRACWNPSHGRSWLPTSEGDSARAISTLHRSSQGRGYWLRCPAIASSPNCVSQRTVTQGSSVVFHRRALRPCNKSQQLTRPQAREQP
ncbi:hypothetical protein CDEST_11047 [Colletotrichum destructivum]|uniref:Uncharacterized protein n=1 Tax=Colletotrichum destructivum TaxID=34406 RepID=A0AAX4ISB4_9PEZI|nr:hypothetical protein CDEST_11047 [Colletotrichum destructivum]